MRILVATRGNRSSENAVRLADIVSQMVPSDLVLLSVLSAENERARAEAALSRASTRLEEALSVDTIARVGTPEEEIVQEATAGSYDLLIVGQSARRRWPWRRWFRRSLLSRLIAKTPCPLLIARGSLGPLRHVLVCDSGRQPSLLDDLTSRLRPFVSQVDALTVLHVMSQIAAAPGVAGWELRADADTLIDAHTPEGALLERDLERLEPLPVQLEAKVRHGLVVDEILKEARHGHYDLVVIGAHRETGWERFLLDDLAGKVVRRGARPLLVV